MVGGVVLSASKAMKIPVPGFDTAELVILSSSLHSFRRSGDRPLSKSLAKSGDLVERYACRRGRKFSPFCTQRPIKERIQSHLKVIYLVTRFGLEQSLPDERIDLSFA